MNIIKLHLYSKNNKKNGIYMYSPVIEKDGLFYYGESITTKRPIQIKDFPAGSLKIVREIQPAFYEANGITNYLNQKTK